jgi:hypothetical protein
MTLTMRNALLTGTAFASLGVAGCTNNQIDPAKVIDGIKTACGIAVTAATIVAIIGLDPTMSISAIINLVCTGFHSAQENGKLKATEKGATIHFPVTVNGKTVDVEAVVQ